MLSAPLLKVIDCLRRDKSANVPFYTRKTSFMNPHQTGFFFILILTAFQHVHEEDGTAALALFGINVIGPSIFVVF